jgi:hypothetical protein
MKKKLLWVIGGAAFCAALVLGQNLPPTVPALRTQGFYQPTPKPETGAEARKFEFDGKGYRCLLLDRDILSGPDWNPGATLPISFAKVEEIARGQLQTVGAEDSALQLTDFQLNRLLDKGETKWYWAVTFRSLLDMRGAPFDRVTVLVTLGGNPGKIARHLN